MLSFLKHTFICHLPLLIYAVVWTVVLSATVAVISLSPEMAFVRAISPSSSFSRACEKSGVEPSVRVLTEVPGEVVCLPAVLFESSKLDFIVPPVFAAVVVIAAAFFVQAIGLWEVDEEDTTSGEA